jgi:choline dehydrogenase
MSDVVGFIGAGQLGEPMVARLLGAGHDVRVYARRADVRDRHFFTSAYDRKTGAALLRTMRTIFAQSPIAERISHETFPGPDAQSDDALIDSALDAGYCGYHAVGTCAMGPSDDDVVDERLRVRGISALRVVDCSMVPTMVAGNLNGPIMAMAWRAADLILQDQEAHNA